MPCNWPQMHTVRFWRFCMLSSTYSDHSDSEIFTKIWLLHMCAEVMRTMKAQKSGISAWVHQMEGVWNKIGMRSIWLMLERNKSSISLKFSVKICRTTFLAFFVKFFYILRLINKIFLNIILLSAVLLKRKIFGIRFRNEREGTSHLGPWVTKIEAIGTDTCNVGEW